MLVVNDPYLGGTHLPDVTVIAPVFVSNTLIGFAANRAHHEHWLRNARLHADVAAS